MHAVKSLTFFCERAVALYTTVISDRIRDNGFFILGLLLLLISPCASNAGYEEDIIQLANQGDAEAQYALALLYEYGSETTARDKQKSLYLLQLSAEQRVAGACLYLGLKYEHGNGLALDNKKAVCYYLCAAQQHWPMAQFFLADFYAKGKGVDKSVLKALAWLGLAREYGYARADAEFLELQKQSGMNDSAVLAPIQQQLMEYRPKSCN